MMTKMFAFKVTVTLSFVRMTSKH